MATGQTAVTGLGGSVHVGNTQLPRVTQWSVNPKLAHTSEWGDSDSGGYTCRAAGRRDATFSVEGKLGSNTNVITVCSPGTNANATLTVAGAVGWSFPSALCNDFKLTVNVDTEEVVGWTSDWGADGPFSYG